LYFVWYKILKINKNVLFNYYRFNYSLTSVKPLNLEPVSEYTGLMGHVLIIFVSNTAVYFMFDKYNMVWVLLSRLSSSSIDKCLASSIDADINEQCRWYRAWLKFILLWAVYSSFFTPMEFGFFRGLPENLFILDIVGQIAFLVDIVLQFFVAYRDSQTYRMVYKRTPIALR